MALCSSTLPSENTIRAAKGAFMLDLVMLALGLGFFALTVGYAFACDRL
jgi:hypothetical protein